MKNGVVQVGGFQMLWCAPNRVIRGPMLRGPGAGCEKFFVRKVTVFLVLTKPQGVSAIFSSLSSLGILGGFPGSAIARTPSCTCCTAGLCS